MFFMRLGIMLTSQQPKMTHQHHQKEPFVTHKNYHVVTLLAFGTFPKKSTWILPQKPTQMTFRSILLCDNLTLLMAHQLEPSAQHQHIRLMLSLMFLVVFTFVMSRIVRDVLILESYSHAHLAAMYIGVAICVSFVTSRYRRLYQYHGRQQVGRILMTGFLILTAVLSAAITTQYHVAILLYYVLVEVIGVIQLIYIWTLAGDLFQNQDNVRVFPKLTLAGLVAGVCAAVLTGSLSALLGVQILLWGILACHIVIFVLLHRILAQASNRFTHIDNEMRREESQVFYRFNFRQLLQQNAHIRWLTMIVIMTFLTVPMIDFEFKRTFDIYNQQLGGSADQLAVYFSALISLSGVIGIVIQLIFAERLLKRFGHLPGLLILPLSFLSTAGLSLVTSLVPTQLPMPVIRSGLNKFIENSLRYSLYDTSMQLLYTPLAEHIRTHVKAILDGVIKPFALGFAGLFLTGASLLFPDHLSSILSLCTTSCALFWCFSAWKTHGTFRQALEQQVARLPMQHHIETPKTTPTKPTQSNALMTSPGSICWLSNLLSACVKRDQETACLHLEELDVPRLTPLEQTRSAYGIIICHQIFGNEINFLQNASSFRAHATHLSPTMINILEIIKTQHPSPLSDDDVLWVRTIEQLFDAPTRETRHRQIDITCRALKHQDIDIKHLALYGCLPKLAANHLYLIPVLIYAGLDDELQHELEVIIQMHMQLFQPIFKEIVVKADEELDVQLHVLRQIDDATLTDEQTLSLLLFDAHPRLSYETAIELFRRKKYIPETIQSALLAHIHALSERIQTYRIMLDVLPHGQSQHDMMCRESLSRNVVHQEKRLTALMQLTTNHYGPRSLDTLRSPNLNERKLVFSYYDKYLSEDIKGMIKKRFLEAPQHLGSDKTVDGTSLLVRVCEDADDPWLIALSLKSLTHTYKNKTPPAQVSTLAQSFATHANLLLREHAVELLLECGEIDFLASLTLEDDAYIYRLVHEHPAYMTQE